MKLELTWPSGFKSAIWSGCGSGAGASRCRREIRRPVGAGGPVDAGATDRRQLPNDVLRGRKRETLRDGLQRCGAEIEAAVGTYAEPRPISSIAGMTARGTIEAVPDE